MPNSGGNSGVEYLVLEGLSDHPNMAKGLNIKIKSL